ncbi:MAG: acyl-CoA dehydrogenase family protein [Rhodospirillaceae bacterium]|nr:acyl-CoA dehydrogenase family protein [Rhodospirillaceae bacterium]
MDESWLGWPFFEPRHRDLATRLSAWAAANVHEGDHTDDVDDACRKLVRDLGQAGWLRHAVPAAYGGVHETIQARDLCLIRDTLARKDGLADFAFAMQGLGTGPISLFGSEELKRKYLPDVAAGKKIAAFAMTESQAGSDAAAIITTAERDGDSYILNGHKAYISNGGIADHYVVLARTGEAPGARGLSAFVVDFEGTPGVWIGERYKVIAPHPLGRLRFNSARVPASQMIGKPGEGFKIVMATLDLFRPSVGAAALGFARRALDESLKRARTREMFGATLGDLQLTQARLADMAVDVDAAALLIYRAAWTRDSGAARTTREAAMAKLFATEAAQRVVDGAVQLFGGQGVIAPNVVERLYREVRAIRIYEGASEVQKLVIARQIMS